MIRASLAWLLPLLSLACGDGGPSSAPLAPQGGAAGAAQAGAAGAPQGGATQGGAAGAAQAGAAGAGQAGAAGALPVLSAAATDSTVTLPFTVAITGVGTKKVGDISIVGDVGHVTVGGVSYPAVTYEHQAWPEFGYELYQTLAVGPDRLYSLWFYCKGAALDWVYLEGTDGTKMTDEPTAAGGTCALQQAPSSPAVKFPAVSFVAPPIVTGFEVHGAQIDLPSGEKGRLTLGPMTHDVFVFDTVDCTKDCGAQPWWELHALLWDEAQRRVCFSIFYLFPGASQVSAQYSLSLPDLGDPVGDLTLTATWSKL
ncbi:MAG: hypothetical protein IT374_17335 [Polyangiaceae bacterium]|nr:hypothetical protein [Polyangiaceae bacterium]